MEPVRLAGAIAAVLVLALATAVYTAPEKAGRWRGSLLPLGAAGSLLALLAGLFGAAATLAVPLSDPWLWAPLLVALLALVPRPAADSETPAVAETSDLRDAAKAVAVAGQYLQQAVEPFQASIIELRETVAKLDTEAAAARMRDAADSFAAKLEAGAGQLTAAGDSLRERQEATVASFDAAADTVTAMKANLEQVGAGFDRLAEALAPAREAAEALRAGLESLAEGEAQRVETATQLRDLLAQVQASQEPLLAEMQRAGAAMTEAGGDLRHLVREMNANEETVAERLDEVHDRLSGAAERMEQAVEQWGKLVRSGLASSHEFSRQAIEALLARLEQSPPDFAAVAEAARGSAQVTEQMGARIEASLGAFERGMAELRGQLLAVGESARGDLEAAVAALSGPEVKQLALQLAGLHQTVAGLEQTFGQAGGLNTLAAELKRLRSQPAATAGEAPAVRRPSLVSRILLGVALVYILFCLGVMAGLLPRLELW